MLNKKSRIICLFTAAILFLSILPLMNTQMIGTGSSEYQQVIDALYDLNEDYSQFYSDEVSKFNYDKLSAFDRFQNINSPRKSVQAEDFEIIIPWDLNEDRGQIIKSMIDSHPTLADKYNYVYTQVGGSPDDRNILIDRFVSGNYPNLITCTQDWYSEFSQFDIWYDLAPNITEWNTEIGRTDWLTDIPMGWWNVLDGVNGDGTGDSIFGLPFFGQTVLPYVNIDHFEAVGLDYMNPGSELETIDEWLTTCQVLADAGFTPFAMVGEYSSDLAYMNYMLGSTDNYISSRYPPATVYPWDVNGLYGVNGALSVEGFAAYLKMKGEGWVQPTVDSTTGPGANNLFGTGQASMVFVGPWGTKLFEIFSGNVGIKLNFTAVDMPASSDGVRSTIIGGGMSMVPRFHSDEMKQDAVDLAEWLLEGQNQMKTIDLWRIPVRKSLKDEPWFTEAGHPERANYITHIESQEYAYPWGKQYPDWMSIHDNIMMPQYHQALSSVSWSGGYADDDYYQMAQNALDNMAFEIETNYLSYTEPQLRVAFDISHSPSWGHEDAFLLDIYLDTVNVELYYFEDIFELSEDIDVLLVPPSTAEYSPDELIHIEGWFSSAGKKLLWVAGDSDYGGWYTPDNNNAILNQVGALLRLSADTVDDYVFNDGAPYRVAGQPVSDGPLSSTFTDGVYNAIFHGPTTVLGFQYDTDTVIDLTEDSITDVEVVMSTGFDSGITNWDESETEFDYYDQTKPFGEAYPLMAVDYHYGDGKYVIASGEATFTSYKLMYDMHTDQGLWGNRDTYTGGLHNGKILVDNVLNFLGLDPILPKTYGHAPIYIYSDDEFLANDFTGSGTSEDPYRLEGYLFASHVEDLITIQGTSAYFEIVDNYFFGLFSGMNAIHLFDVRNAVIESNHISQFGTGISMRNSQDCLLRFNEIFNNEFGIYIENSKGVTVCARNTLYGNNEGIFISKDPYPVVNIWPGSIVEVFDSESITWQMTFRFETEELALAGHEAWDVILAVDGEPVEVDPSDVYYEDWGDDRPWKFDFKYFSDPLSEGYYPFYSQFFNAGVKIFERTAEVTVVPTPWIRNVLFQNELFDNYNGIHLQNAVNDLLVSNNIMNSYGEGIGIYGSSLNEIKGNQVGYSGMKGIMVAHDFGWDIESEYNYIANNVVFGGNEDGISLEWSNNNLVENNEIFDNQWAGIRLYGTSSYNDIIGNTIHDNWGGGIDISSYSEVHMRFWQDITATEADHISWQATFSYEDEGQAWYEYDSLNTILTVDGERVDVWYSEVYWDDWGDPESPNPWHFNADYYSEPLSVGEHEFHVEFFLDGVLLEEWTSTAIVTVEPATEEKYVSHNNIIGNEIFSNEWSGIYVWKTYSNLLMDNQIYQHYGDGIHIEDAANNVIDFNTIFENDVGIGINSANNNILSNNDIFGNYWDGIHLSGTASENTLSDNMIHNNWGNGIGLDTYSDVFISFYPTFMLGIPVIASEADSIQLHVTWGFEEEDQAWDELYRTEAILMVDGEPVNVWYSDVFWDDWGIPGFPYPWHFTADFNSDPLPAGVHDFTIQFFLDGDLVQEETASVTIIPATDDEYTSHNYIANNDISQNSWTGINIWRSHNNIIETNTISSN
ncbi:MAG: extracellular solute-binding protein, partial [Candidatus Kariarchaeaceae archaeon]